ncbi:leucine rich repeat domain-containing protein [Phthorimaea operculella]|nr:leucine rich repeat domain-containing protein [Phthorimaea operculella]
MSTRRILALFFAAFVLVEGRWHTQKREVASICDPINSSILKVSCFCIKQSRELDVIKSADCFVTTEGVKPNDNAWNAFEELKNSTKVTLSNSRGHALHYIPTHALKHLEGVMNIDVTYGTIKKIHRYAFANLSSVEEIGIRDSQVEVLEPHAFANHKSLSTIKLDKNNIAEINRDIFINLPSLERLFLTENQITTIHDHAFVHLSTLKELEINMNKLFSLNSETFSGLKKLQKLDLSSNNLEVIGDNTFYPLKNLKTLNLDGNNIQMLDEKAFRGLSKLQYLTLAHNKLSNTIDDEVFDGLQELMSLSLKANGITELNTKAMTPLLNNFYSEHGHLDVEDNNFPCNCKLDWFVQLMNRTKSKVLKISLENLKCIPDSKLQEQWNKMAEATPPQEVDPADGGQTGDEYEYYDDSQLNGKLFYIDVRDLIPCGNSKPKIGTSTRDFIMPAIVPKDTKVTSPSTAASNIITNRPSVNAIPKKGLPSNVPNNDQQENFGLLDLSKSETSPKPEEVTSEDKSSSVNVYDNMAADEAKPDKLKTQRSFHAELKDMPSNSNKNVACVALISLTYLRLFH